MEIGLSLGSNLSDRLKNLQEGRKALAALPDIDVIAQSAVYETEPVDVRPEYAEQCFLNSVVVLETVQDPALLSVAIHRIEDTLGRTRSEDRNAPRPLDIDMIYAGDLCSQSPELKLPHPRWAERRFVVAPLADVRPNLVLPGQRMSVASILLSLPQSPKVFPFSREW